MKIKEIIQKHIKTNENGIILNYEDLSHITDELRATAIKFKGKQPQFGS